ncbi:hypothetical protein ACFQPA_11785 [Halomarina halobia]|uniref:Major facilitator superfamily (MFS) profile domain-containing protein n=1 Tax=Halomarina halobia TaxID=3033386 RepID=A0ABD6ABF5_9EURY|nr:hypothetical protein [Halomarina sp. PSR21]
MSPESSLPESLRTTLVLLAAVCTSVVTTLVIGFDRSGVRSAALAAAGGALLVAIVRRRFARSGD